MKKLQLNKLSLKNLTTPLLALSLSLGCIGLFGGSVRAVSVGLSHNSTATANAAAVFGGAFSIGAFPTGSGGTTTATFSNSGPQSHMIDVYDIAIPSTCLPDVLSIKLNSTYITSPAPLPFDEGLGGFVSIGDFTGSPTFWGVATPASGHLGHPSGPTTVVFTGHSTTTGESSVDPSDMVVDATWSGSAPTGALQVVVVADADNDTGPPDLNIGDTVSMTLPTADVTFSTTSACASSPISPSPDTSTTLPSAPVTINILGNDGGSNLKVSKIDGQDIVIGQTITLTNGSGTVKLNTDGTITFTPTSTFTGESSFSYSITDGTSTVDNGTVKVTVASATAPEPVTPSQNNPTSTTKTNTASTKPMLANTGENARSLMIVFTTLLVLASYFKFKNKGAQEYRR